MAKIKKFIFVLFIVVLIPIKINAVNNEDDYEEIDYVWLEEEIKNAKEQNEPKVNSKCAVVFDRASKTIIWGKNEKEEVPMASTTKIMTAIVMLENIVNMDDKIEVSKQAANIGGSRLGLKEGDIISYKDLLYGLLLCSGNDAATQIAISLGGSIENFAILMNQKAEAMGLVHTHFVTPHGLDNKEHYTTAEELAKITDYALNIEKFAEIVATKTYTVTINGYTKKITNTNELLGYLEGVNGVKTGFTNGAGRCLVTSASRNNFNIITVVLGADTKKIRTQDSIKLIEYTYNNYTLIDLEEKIKDEFEKWRKINEKRIYVYKGIQEKIETILGDIKYYKYPVLKENEDNINISIESLLRIEAPIERRKKLGIIKVMLDNVEIMSVDILNKNEIGRKNCYTYFQFLLEKAIR